MLPVDGDTSITEIRRLPFLPAPGAARRAGAGGGGGFPGGRGQMSSVRTHRAGGFPPFPLDRTPRKVDRKVDKVDRRARPVDRTARTVDRTPAPQDREVAIVDRRAVPLDRRPVPVDRKVDLFTKQASRSPRSKETRRMFPMFPPRLAQARRAFLRRSRGLVRSISPLCP